MPNDDQAGNVRSVRPCTPKVMALGRIGGIWQSMTAAELRVEAAAKRSLAHSVAQMARIVSLNDHRKLLKDQVQDLLANALYLDARPEALKQRI